MTTRRLIPVALAACFCCPPAAVAEKKERQPPAPGAVFRFDPAAPKYVTCDVEFRDPKEVFWPNFFYGRPAVAGTYTFDPLAPKADFALLCDDLVQKNGDQSRRVLGELLGGPPPAVAFAVRSLGAFQAGKVEYAPFEGTLAVGDKKVQVRGRAVFRYGYSKGSDAPDSAAGECAFSIDGLDLGLKDAAGPIQVRVGATAYVDPKK